MKHAFAAGIALIGILCAASCGILPTYGSGTIATKTFELRDFAGISAQNATSVTVSIGEAGTFAVSASCDDNLIDHLRISVADGILAIEGLDISASTLHGIRVNVIMPALSSVTAGNASSIRVGELTAAAMTVKASSASSIVFDSLTATSIDADLDSASSLEATGASACADIDLTVASASLARLYPLTASGRAAIHVSSASSAYLTANGTIEGSVTDASTVRYKGTAASTVTKDLTSSVSHSN
jgi:hypothetical protein